MEFDSEKGLRIAKVIGGKNEDILYVYDKDAMCCKSCSKKCNLSNKVCCNSCNEVLIHGAGDNLKNKFENMRDIKLNDNFKFQLMPSNLPNSQPCLLYVSGPRGVGKSVFVSNYLIQFKKLYPKYKIYLFSRKEKDDALDDLINKRVQVDDMPDADLKADDFKKSMVIFDDIDTLCNKDKKHDVKGAVYNLLNDIIEVGRSMGIFCICTSHIPANFNESKRIINGASSITLFTTALNANAIYLLEKQIGLTKDEIKRIRRLKSRTVTIIKSIHPNVILSEKEARFVENQ
jgi:hypothetical protein